MSGQRLKAVTPIADDGDELHFCSTCAFSAACLAEGYDKRLLRDLHVLVEHVGPFREGDHLFREGDPFNAIAAVRAGTVKTYVTDDTGREQVLGFFLPGEVIGLNAIASARYPCNAVALDTVMLCRFSFPMMATLASRMPGLQRHLFNLLSQDIGKASLLAGSFTADERLAHMAPWLQNADTVLDDASFPIFADHHAQIEHALKSLAVMGVRELGVVYASPAARTASKGELERTSQALKLRLVTLPAGANLTATAQQLPPQAPSILLFMGGTPERIPANQVAGARRTP